MSSDLSPEQGAEAQLAIAEALGLHHPITQVSSVLEQLRVRLSDNRLHPFVADAFCVLCLTLMVMRRCLLVLHKDSE